MKYRMLASGESSVGHLEISANNSSPSNLEKTLIPYIFSYSFSWKQLYFLVSGIIFSDIIIEHEKAVVLQTRIFIGSWLCNIVL